jgi:molybdate transport system permease protein
VGWAFLSLSDEEWTALRLSVKVGICAVILSLAPATAIGYFLARRSFPGKWLAQAIVDLPLVLPPVVTGYLLLVVFGPRGPVGAVLARWLNVHVVFTWQGAALASAIVSFPLMVRAIRLAFQGIDSRLELAARSLGAGRFDAFCTVTIPLAKRGLIAGCVLAFARSLGEFGATIMIAGNIEGETRTIPLAIFSLVNRPDGVEQSWRLVVISILLACAALATGEFIERRQAHRESA